MYTYIFFQAVVDTAHYHTAQFYLQPAFNLFNDAVTQSHCIASNDSMTMNNEIKRYIFSSFHGELFNNIFPGRQPRQMVLGTLVYSPFNHLTRLLARGYLWKTKITPKEGIAKTPIMMVGVTAKVWERNLPNAVKKCYRTANSLAMVLQHVLSDL